MNIARRSKKLTIFEGPDGGGKSTVAKRYAAETDAHYVHFGPLKGVRKDLCRLYVEAMIEALMGTKNVVFDRSWLSEYPYGTAYRNGADRVGPINQRMLERLALRCGACVVYCLPKWATVQSNFKGRHHDEYLPNTRTLKQVYDLYTVQKTALPSVTYDYQTTAYGDLLSSINIIRPERHIVDIHSAGNLNASVALVGEAFAELGDGDPWYRWPFGSFSKRGCSWWLTEQLHEANISERDLFWVNVDQLAPHQNTALSTILPMGAAVIALGTKAMAFLSNRGVVDHYSYEHPQAHRRFKTRQPYPLTTMMTELLQKKRGAR